MTVGAALPGAGVTYTPDAGFSGKINLTSFDPDPSVNHGQNYAQLRSMLLAARDG